jgi:hypothetical protein
MAEVTVNTREDTIMGNKRVLLFDVDIAANADILTTGLTIIDAFWVQNDEDDFTTATKSGGVLTFVSDAAETGVQVGVIGH